MWPSWHAGAATATQMGVVANGRECARAASRGLLGTGASAFISGESVRMRASPDAPHAALLQPPERHRRVLCRLGGWRAEQPWLLPPVQLDAGRAGHAVMRGPGSRAHTPPMQYTSSPPSPPNNNNSSLSSSLLHLWRHHMSSGASAQARALEPPSPPLATADVTPRQHMVEGQLQPQPRYISVAWPSPFTIAAGG